MAWAFITVTQLRNRLSPMLLQRLTDDDRDGVADTGVLAQLIADASGKVASYLGTVMDLTAIQAAATDDSSHEVVRLTLDTAEYMAVKRHPEAAPSHDWVELMKAVNADLKMVRESKTRIDTTGAVNSPANVGGTLHPDSSDLSVGKTFYRDGFGDY